MDSNGNGVSITQLPIQQLQLIKQEIEQDLKVLTQSYAQLREAFSKFQLGQSALKSLTPSNQDKKMLVPLTQSLYVPGLLSDVQKVIVDVGTGYFVDMDVKDANAFYTRKTAFIKESMDKLEVTINQKQDQRGAVMEVIQTKLSMIQKESQAARQATASSNGPAIATASA